METLHHFLIIALQSLDIFSTKMSNSISHVFCTAYILLLKALDCIAFKWNDLLQYAMLT